MADNDVKALKHKRTALKSHITRMFTYIERLNGLFDLTDLQMRKNNITPYLTQFEEIQYKIEILDETDIDEEERTNFEERYYKLISLLQRSIDGLKSNDSKPMQTSKSNTRLPVVNLPTFSGSYEDWLNFHDMFNSIIHADISIPDIQKMHYLKTSLSGDAAAMLQSLSITKENYNIAWDMLKSRYDRKRLIAYQHINSIVNLPVLSKESHLGLRQLLNALLKHTRSLEALGKNIDNWDDVLVCIITHKLDPTTSKEWENTIPTHSTFPTLKELTNFLNKRCEILEAGSRQSHTVSSNGKNSKTASHIVTSILVCPICSKNHPSYRCETFQNLTVTERINTAKSKRMCLNCLKLNHRTNDCKASLCKTCKRRHHTLLHLEQANNSETSSKTNSNVTIANFVSKDTEESQTILSTALIFIKDIKGQQHECRALLDCGSQSNFITKALVDRLGIKQEHVSMPVSGFNQAHTLINNATKIQISSRINAFQTNVKCLVTNKITSNLPVISINRSTFTIPKNIRLADPEFNISKPIDMLIGVDLFWKLMCVGQIKSSDTQPLLQKTHFGWIVAGTIAPTVSSSQTVCNLITNDSLDKKLTSFWQLEECSPKQTYSQEERACESHFQNNFTRDECGRFVVKLPFKENIASLGNSYSLASKRFFNLERRLNKNPSLKEQYCQFLDEYQQLGHMKICNIDPLHEDSSLSFYLPHHGVEKRDSTTTKLRVVFDGSCKTSTGISLNDRLMVGPTIQQDLFSIVSRFRTHRFAITADIAKMYRQVKVHESDINYQRIIWRSDPQENIKIFSLSTVAYGTSASSFLAIRALHQLAFDDGAEFSVGSKTVLRDFYVDDLLTGADTYENAKIVIEETRDLLKKGGFELRKWHSNCSEILSNSNLNLSQENIHTIDNSDNVKTLGLSWNTVEDIFFYHLPNQREIPRITKRSILSYICQLFDPLGLVGPIIITGKLMMQKLWQLKIDWDESLPSDITTKFSDYKEQLLLLKHLKIPRRVIPFDNSHIVELHGFCDASENAYGACVYIRSLDNLGNISSNLLCAKSKVAPIKLTTIPRLELCGALLLSHLMQKIKNTINIDFKKTYYWTDSEIVLAWLKSTTKQWKTFVANRVNEILELSNVNQWHHVRSEDNPADIISRGCSPIDLNNCNLWWHGPTWILKNINEFTATISLDSINPIPEEKVTTCTITLNKAASDIFSKFSTLSKLIRVVSYCRRFINNIKARLHKTEFHIQTGHLSSQELECATNNLIKTLQGEQFALDIKHLNRTGTVHSKSKLLPLNPFLDDNGIIRVGGRIKHSNLPYSHKHPVVLPAKHEFTSLLIDHYHKKQLHAGLQGTIAAVRSRYWPLNLRNTAKNILRKCVTCFKVNPRSATHIMGDLPQTRLGEARPFINSGVDFCGPFHIRELSKRNSKTHKVYVAIFICFSTKAVHIEIVNDLTSEAFINTLKRFMARRGKVLNLYSDNASNFVGANKELRILYDNLVSQRYQEAVAFSFAEDKFNWHFIPPRSPHFGGLWEAAVKSTKHHMRRIIGNTNFTYEQLHTLLVQIESILNSRPLTAMSEDPNDFSFLTPSHFLIGDCLTAIPEPSILDLKVNRLSHWQHIEQLKQHFWKRWHKEYLSQLQERAKWRVQGNDILTPGKLVIIKDDNLPPLRWMMGRIDQLHPGPDGVSRAATVRVKNDFIKRPVTRLCVLPIP